MKIHLMGLDIGTSGCKAVIFDASGKEVASAHSEYSLIFSQGGSMELDPELVAASALSCIKRCAEVCGGEHIAAIAVSSQGEAIIPVDKEGRPLMNAIVTFDSRCRNEFTWLSHEFGGDMIANITGAPIHTMFSLPKILWVKNNRPEVYDKAWKFLCFGDYISFRLGAVPVIDYSMASRTMAFDIRTKTWSEQILGRCGISVEKMPEVAGSGTVIGAAGRTVASATGLRENTKIVAGGHDQACCALGAGVLTGGSAMDSLGTTESILCVHEVLRSTASMRTNNIPCYCYPVNNFYAYLTFLSSSGAILKWFRDSITSGKESLADMDRKAQEQYPGGSGLMVLPHFAGSGTPYLDFDSKGIMVGLTLGTSRYQIHRAILESTCFESRINIENMEQSGIEVNDLICVGGGARSELWLQMKADITGKTVTRSPVVESGCLGAAILAGMGAGVYRSAGDVFAGTVMSARRFSPNCEMKKHYDKIYVRYKRMYGLSRELC